MQRPGVNHKSKDSLCIVSYLQSIFSLALSFLHINCSHTFRPIEVINDECKTAELDLNEIIEEKNCELVYTHAARNQQQCRRESSSERRCSYTASRRDYPALTCP